MSLLMKYKVLGNDDDDDDDDVHIHLYTYWDL